MKILFIYQSKKILSKLLIKIVGHINLIWIGSVPTKNLLENLDLLHVVQHEIDLQWRWV